MNGKENAVQHRDLLDMMPSHVRARFEDHLERRKNDAAEVEQQQLEIESSL